MKSVFRYGIGDLIFASTRMDMGNIHPMNMEMRTEMENEGGDGDFNFLPKFNHCYPYPKLLKIVLF